MMSALGRPAMSVGIIGAGAIARALLGCLAEHDGGHSIEVVAMLNRSGDKAPAFGSVVPRATLTSDCQAFWERAPSLIVECAGHEAVRKQGPEVLARGRDLLLISVGALAHSDTEQALRAATAESRGRLLLPSGAVGGIDLLASARLGGLSRVVYNARKPTLAWVGTRAERSFDLARLTKPTELFRGNAREAAQEFPQNANVAATIALAGVGFEATEVVLIADPEVKCNEHWFTAEGAFGRAEVKIAGNPLPQNPKTSWLAALSLARAVLNANARVVI